MPLLGRPWTKVANCWPHFALRSEGADLMRRGLQVKSYLMGNPDIKMALNENLTIGRQDGAQVRHMPLTPVSCCCLPLHDAPSLRPCQQCSLLTASPLSAAHACEQAAGGLQLQ